MFLHINNKHVETKIKNIVSKKIQYLGKNLPKNTKFICWKFQMLMKEITHLNEETFHVHWLENNIVKMLISPKIDLYA